MKLYFRQAEKQVKVSNCKNRKTANKNLYSCVYSIKYWTNGGLESTQSEVRNGISNNHQIFNLVE